MKNKREKEKKNIPIFSTQKKKKMSNASPPLTGWEEYFGNPAPPPPSRPISFEEALWRRDHVRWVLPVTPEEFSATTTKKVGPSSK